MTLLRLGFLVAFFTGCSGCPPTPGPTATGTQVTLTNLQVATTVYVAFGADSKIQAADWASFCTPNGALNCSFSLTDSQALPNAQGAYLNATIAFGSPVGCGATKAELNVNNPAWYDTFDVSLVDGYSNKVGMVYTPPASADAGAPVALGPPVGATGNEKVLGVFPFGCDICVAKQNPPCNIPKGTDGCKAGTQNNPTPPCQVQGAVKGGGGALEVVLFP